MLTTILIGALLVGAGFFFYNYGKKTQTKSDKIMESLRGAMTYDVQTVNGELPFSDVVSYFKSLSLKKGRDIPFVADANVREIQKMLTKAPVGEFTLLLGTYNEETDSIENVRIIVADEMDEKCCEMMKNSHLVVLN